MRRPITVRVVGPLQWIVYPALTAIAVTVLLAIPLRLFGLSLPEPVLPIVLAFAWRGLFGWSGLWLALAAGPAYGAGLWVGSALFGVASESTFRRAAYGLILAAAVLGMPLWDPLTGR